MIFRIGGYAQHFSVFLGMKKTPAVRRGSDTDQQGLQSFGLKPA
jgi:hypothetical protein